LIEVLIEMVPGGFVVYHVMELGSYYGDRWRRNSGEYLEEGTGAVRPNGGG